MVTVDGQTIHLNDEDILVQTESRGGLAVASEKGVTVAVDTTLTPALIEEGLARDLVRTVNNLRKEAGLALDDRIHLAYQAEGDVAAALTNFAEMIQAETLTLSLTAVPPTADHFSQTANIGGQTVTLGLRKA
jgi:isoleucyl-tRNA synthetase